MKTKMKKDHIARFLIATTDTIKELLLVYLAAILVASGIFTIVENMPFLDSMWMSFVAATSTGFGDLTPKTLIGRVTCVLLMHFTLLFIIPMIVARILSSIVRDQNAFTHEEQEWIKNKQIAIESKIDDICKQLNELKVVELDK